MSDNDLESFASSIPSTYDDLSVKLAKLSKKASVVQFDPSFDSSNTTSTSFERRQSRQTDKRSLKESISWLERHVPRCVMRDLTREVLRLNTKEKKYLVMPHAQTYKAALLFIDMSGFTKLSLLLDLESLSKVRQFMKTNAR